MICRMDFDMVFGILIFDPKYLLCMNLCVMSLFVMTDFENGVIFRVFGVFWSGFLHRTTVNNLWSGF